MLSLECVRNNLDLVFGGELGHFGNPEDSYVCVRQLHYYIMDGRDEDGVISDGEGAFDWLCACLNDEYGTAASARTEAMLPLARVAVSDLPEDWAEVFVRRLISEVLAEQLVAPELVDDPRPERLPLRRDGFSGSQGTPALVARLVDREHLDAAVQILVEVVT